MHIEFARFEPLSVTVAIGPAEKMEIL